ncbi:hypothetical protein Hanom_Chr13g01220011 [Helianthus anomalus]
MEVEASPSVVSSPVPADREEVANMVTPIINEDIHGPQSKENFQETDGDLEGFIPGNLFDFEENNGEFCENVGQGNVVNKRKKKSGIGNEARTNPAYSSSLEKTKVGKKSKCVEDIFGLDPLLGLEGDIGHQVDSENPGLFNEHLLNEKDGHNAPVTSVIQTTVPLRSQMENEVGATIMLGEKLGVNLQYSHHLIQEAIVNEGVQIGMS